MLSKIKSNAEARISLANENSSQSASEHEQDTESINQDNNNNNNSNNNNSNSNSKSVKNPQPGEGRKRSREELLDIVEVSRERRLSKDSADSLGNFIRWSFGHRLDQAASIQQLRALSVGDTKSNELDDEAENMLASDEDEPGRDDDDDDDWLAATSRSQQHHQHHHHRQSFLALNKLQLGFDQQAVSHRQQQAKLSPTSGATNLTVARSEKLPSGANLLSDIVAGRGIKRARTHLLDSPSPTMFGQAPARKTSGYLGNVVERLHQQQLQQQRQHQHQEIDQEAQVNESLSEHLQRFLQQRSSMDDLCSQVGIDDNNQLALAAAIHRALVDSVGPNATSIDNKSTASSTGSSSGGSSNNNNNNTNSLNLSRVQQQREQASLGTSGANLSLADPMNRQRRVYNTRAAMHGAMGSHNSAPSTVGPASLAAIASQQQVNSSQPSSLGGRVHAQHQQQRHAQAAAALSALASVGSHLAAAAAAANHPQYSGPTSTAGLGLGVDFECDTCGSSFDDRHRLMQHQSIHLELKKDWFTETPVDEVMKIFNRRRGEFLCNICNLRFEATLDYDQHNHQVHGPRPYCCQFCGNGTRTFKCWRQYLNHLYDHRYIFSCTIDDCDFTVNRRDSLRFHIFRFHLNCQLPQNQQTQPLRVNQHHPPIGLHAGSHISGGGANSRKWTARTGSPGMDEPDELAMRDGDDLLGDEINVAD